MLAGQILTVCGYLCAWTSMVLKKKKYMLLTDYCCRVCNITAFLCLGKYDGMSYTAYTLLRNSAGLFLKTKKQKLVAAGILSCLLIGLLIFTWSGYSSVALLVCGLLNTFGYVALSEQGMRITGMIGSGFYLAYHISIGNVAGCICETIMMTVCISSYIRTRKKEASECDISNGS